MLGQVNAHRPFSLARTMSLSTSSGVRIVDPGADRLVVAQAPGLDQHLRLDAAEERVGVHDLRLLLGGIAGLDEPASGPAASRIWARSSGPRDGTIMRGV